MAAGTILSVLSNIPWGQVVENAPKVAEAAGRLWKSVTKRGEQAEEAAEQLAESASRGASEADLLKARVAALEDATHSLEEQLQASSKLIKELAEQNTLLVQRIEISRLKVTRAAAAGAAGFLVLLALVVYALLRV